MNWKSAWKEAVVVCELESAWKEAVVVCELEKCMERSCGSLNHINISSCPGRHTNCAQVLPLRELSSYFALHQFKSRLQSVLLAFTVTPSNRPRLGMWCCVTGWTDYNFSEDCWTLRTQPQPNFGPIHPLNNTASCPCRLISPVTPSQKCKYCIWPHLLPSRLHITHHSQILHSFLLHTT